MKTKKTLFWTILALTGMFLLPFNSRGQTFQTPPTQISPELALSSGVTSHFADIDNDGDLDIVHSYSNHLSWYENTNGAGAYVLNQNIGPSPYYARAAFAADLDNDGDLDLLTVSSGGSIIYWHENLNGAGNYGPAQTILTAEYGTNRVLAEDIDGDGFLDLLTAASLSDRVAWYRNDGTGNFGAQQIINSGSQFMDIDTADVDGDGIVDVISASRDDNRIIWYKNDGLGNFTIQPDITDTAMGAAIVFFTDMDGDGDQDALSGSLTDDRILWYDNTDGLGSFGPPQDIPLSPGFDLREIFPADFDLDGDMDIVSASHGSSNSLIAWHENLDCASGIFQQETIDDTVWIWGAVDVKAGDIDLDGDYDVLSLEEAGTELKWYENLTPTPLTQNLPDLIIACNDVYEQLCGPALMSCNNPTYAWYINDLAGGSVLLGQDQCFTPNQVGNYTVEISDENGFALHHTFDVLNEIPVPSISSSGTICNGETITIVGQNLNNPIYDITWYHNGNLVQTGGETLLAAFNSGTITVQVETNGCDPVLDSVEIVDCCPDDLYLAIDCISHTVYIENFPSNITGISSWSHNGAYISGQPMFTTTLDLSFGQGLYEVTVIFELPDGTPCEFHGFIEFFESDCFQNARANSKSTDGAGQSAQILLAPNPTNDIVKLYTKFNSGEYQLYDITGKLIMTSEISVYENSIDLSNYSSGVYILKIQDENGAWHHKRIIKQ